LGVVGADSEEGLDGIICELGDLGIDSELFNMVEDE
jgi:hypothetical protein